MIVKEPIAWFLVSVQVILGVFIFVVSISRFIPYFIKSSDSAEKPENEEKPVKEEKPEDFPEIIPLQENQRRIYSVVVVALIILGIIFSFSL